MKISIDTTAEQDAAIQAIVDNVNASRPLDEKTKQPIGDEQTPEGYFTARIQDVLASYTSTVRETKISAVVEAMRADPAMLEAAVSATATAVEIGGGGIKATPAIKVQ